MQREQQNYVVYALIDPRNNEIRYIGITANPDRRLEEHSSGRGGNIPKRTWITELYELGLTPRMQLLETGLSLSTALEKENFLIQHYLNTGKDLVNLRLTPFLNHSTKQPVTRQDQQKKVKVRLDKLITDAGLRKSELARTTGIHEATIGRICRGQSVTRSTLQKIIDVIQIHLGRCIDIDMIEGITIID